MLTSVQDYRTTRVWQSAHSLAVDVYRLTDELPVHRRIGLIDHARKSAGSISFNIAEGFGRSSHADLARFLQYAIGSANELEAQMLLARDTRTLEHAAATSLLKGIPSVRKMLYALLREVRRQARGSPPS